MILVDTSVLLDWLNHHENLKSKHFDKIVDTKRWGISILTFQEMLQGTKNDIEYDTLKSYLGSCKIYSLPQEMEFWEQSSQLYRHLRACSKSTKCAIIS